MAIAAAAVLAGCATASSTPSPFERPSAFAGHSVHLCGRFENGGLYSGRSGDAVFEVRGAPGAFGRVSNWGRKCLSGVVQSTGYDPSDPNTVCVDYCRAWALDVSAAPPRT